MKKINLMILMMIIQIPKTMKINQILISKNTKTTTKKRKKNKKILIQIKFSEKKLKMKKCFLAIY